MLLNFEQIVQWTGFALTAMVLLYLLFGDNALFRIVSYSFVGVAAGYVAVVIIFQVLIPRLVEPLLRGELLVLVPLILGILLLFKLSPRLSFLGTWSMAVLVGVGAAVAVGGAVFGTLFGQINGTIGLLPRLNQLGQLALSDWVSQFFEGVFVLVGTVSTLAYFQFGAVNRTNQPVRRSRIVEILAVIGQIFIGITLGATFAGVYVAAISAFVERLSAMINVLASLFGS
jgi:hypothetical protein